MKAATARVHSLCHCGIRWQRKLWPRMSPVVSVSLFVCWLSLLLQLCRILPPWSVVTSLAANYGDTVTPVTTIVPAARPCHCKTNGDSSRVRAVTTTSRQISCSHSLCVRMTRLLPSHSRGPISYLPGEPPTLPAHELLRPHMVTTSLHGAHLHSGPTLHIQSTLIQTLIQNLYDT